jgi:threonine-phosphate decarboxylase
MLEKNSYDVKTMTDHKTRQDCAHGGVYSVDPKMVQLDFSSSINPLGISKSVLHEISKELRNLCTIYPDPFCGELKNSILDYLKIGLDPSWLLIGNGATELIHIFARTFLRKKVVIPSPTFCEYELSARRVGAKVKFVPLKNWKLDTERMLAESATSCDAIFLCNPNNPTGLLSSSTSIRKIIDDADSDTYIFIDECFIELVDDGDKKNSMIEMVTDHNNVVILRSLTKSFSLAGIRLGYCICSPNIIARMLENKISWNVNGLAQRLGMMVLKDRSYLEKSRRLIRRERTFMMDELHKMNRFSPLQSDVNFFLIRVSNLSSVEVRDYLLNNRGILVRDCSTFTGMDRRYIRVAVKKRKEDVILLDSLKMMDS